MAETDIGTAIDSSRGDIGYPSADSIDAAYGYPAAYTDYVFNAQKAKATPIPYDQWQRNSNITELSAFLFNSYNAQYQSATGQNLPPQQRSLIINQLSQASPETLDRLYSTWAASQGRGEGLNQYLDQIAYHQAHGAAANKLLTTAESNALKAFGGMTGFLDNAMANATGGVIGSTSSSTSAGNLSPQQYAEQNRRYSLAAEYLKAVGKSPTDDQLNAMMSMNEVDLPKYYQSQPFKLGLTLGQYEDSQSRVGKLYMQYFGRQPTDNEVAWANGKSDADLNQHIMESPSNVSGLNMGQYTSYRNVLDNISQQEYGRNADDTIVKGFHDMLNP